MGGCGAASWGVFVESEAVKCLADGDDLDGLETLSLGTIYSTRAVLFILQRE